DHSITWFVLEALVQAHRSIGIIHFDAHTDLGFMRTLNHGNVFAFVLERPEIASMLQIGLRGMERVADHVVPAPDPRLQFISAREVRAGAGLQALANLPKDIGYYLSFDVDCMNVALAPETGTPAMGGLDFDDALEMVDYIARNLSLVGADFVE